VSELTFEGRVAVVTGAGRGLGRAYAQHLAERGARVVVNDLGGTMDGEGADAGPAAHVVDVITAAGGTALADTSDVATVEGAETLVGTAIERFGGLDVLVNNAGIIRWAGPPDVDADNLAQHLAVHVGGSFNTARAAWPHFVAQSYGRIVMTTSTGLFGLPENTSYATAKGAVLGLARSLATAGARHGIRVNCIAPAAFTRMAGGPDTASETDTQDPRATQMAPELVAPMVGLLAHESCPVTGEVLVAGAGRFSRLFLAVTEGYVHEGGDPTLEDIAAHWEQICDPTGARAPSDLFDWSKAFLTHLAPGS
jgi:NAD(P)-dependent dehydrogenase (short-subunit alcohol dehydrogenase family)